MRKFAFIIGFGISVQMIQYYLHKMLSYLSHLCEAVPIVPQMDLDNWRTHSNCMLCI